MSSKLARAGAMVGATALLSGAIGLGARDADAQAPVDAQEAGAIAVAAYTYLYPLVTMDVTRRQLTNVRARQKPGYGPANMFTNVASLPDREHEGRGAAQFRYALLDRLARSDQGADGRLGPRHGRPLLPAADAGHVDRRVRLARLAHDGHGGGDFSGHAPRLAARSARPLRGVELPATRSASTRRPLTSGSSGAPRRMAPPITTRSTRSRPASRSRRCRVGQAAEAARRRRSIRAST